MRLLILINLGCSLSCRTRKNAFVAFSGGSCDSISAVNLADAQIKKMKFNLAKYQKEVNVNDSSYIVIYFLKTNALVFGDGASASVKKNVCKIEDVSLFQWAPGLRCEHQRYGFLNRLLQVASGFRVDYASI